MSIHKQDIETLLASYVKAHSTGSLRASGNLIPHLFKSLVAFIEEKTGGPVQPSVLGQVAPAVAPERIPAPIIDAAYNPLSIMEDYFFATGTPPQYNAEPEPEADAAPAPVVEPVAEPVAEPEIEAEPVIEPAPAAVETVEEAPVEAETAETAETPAEPDAAVEPAVEETEETTKKTAPKRAPKKA